MCFNITYIEIKTHKLVDRYKEILPPWLDKASIKIDLPSYYFVSGFSHPSLPIINKDGIFLFDWGLIPFWIKDIESANQIQTKTLNAVGETVFEKPSFKNSIAKKRCLLPINGFFEWQDSNKSKYPYFIQLKNNELFSLGCIYETWVDKTTGEIKNTFSILTTPANSLMEKIHNIKKRMPLIISKSDEQKWIDPNLTSEQIKDLIKPFNENEMTAYTVSKNANSSRNNRNLAEILDKVEYPELNLT